MDGQTTEFVMMIVVMPVMFITVAWVLRGLGRFLLHRRAMKTQADMQTKLIDKYGNAPELLDYLKSEAAAGSIRAPEMERSAASPYSRILGAVQTGIVLAFLGAAFLALHFMDLVGGDGFAIIGALGLALGLGFLISGGTAFLLSKSWGLINGDGQVSQDVEI